MACIFCRIAADEVPSRTVYRDDSVVGFLDANPLAPGHTLVVPTEHNRRLSALPNPLARELFGSVHTLVDRVETAVDAEAVTVAVNDGAAAGQEVQHVHCHLVPRFDGDDGGPIHAAMGSRPDLADDELDAIAGRIASGV
jgi:histidine triad (HIT) family protein